PRPSKWLSPPRLVCHTSRGPGRRTRLVHGNCEPCAAALVGPLWQGETQRAENHVGVRRGRRSGRNIKRRPSQRGILRNDLKRAVFRVLPKGVVIAELRLLKLPVGRR